MIRLESLTKVFDTPSGNVIAVDHVSLEVPAGEVCVLLGPSGCGKTTTLKMINRLLAPSSGKIFIEDKDTDAYDVVTLRRQLGYVIQQVGLFPNMTVEENISVVPRLLGWDRKRRRQRAAELLDMMALEPGAFLDRYPNELSGGQQQRIGVARGLAADPPVLLMDEPFGAIDPINRQVIQDEFLKMQAQLHKTVMFVSHDIDEAVKMGDRIAIFREGRIEQYAAPDDMLARPVSGFVADFVGGDRTLKRLRLVTVEQAMDADTPTVTAEDTLDKARELMKQYGHERIVVIDPHGRPRAALRLAELRNKKGRCREHEEPLAVTVRVGDDLRVAVSEMFAHDASWLACVDGEGSFRGIITQQGVARRLGETQRGIEFHEEVP